MRWEKVTTNWSKLMRADFGSKLEIKDQYTLKDKLVGYLTLVKPPFVFMTPLNAASAAVLSISSFPSGIKCLEGVLCAFFASLGANIFNRYVDRVRDKTAWPGRSIPSGRISAGSVLLGTIVMYILSLILCWYAFNLTTFVILLIGLVTSSLYSSHLRDSVGYLSLPPIEGIIFLAGWAALAPQTIFTLTPWVLYFIGVSWQASHIMAHYMVHIRYDGNGQPIIGTPAFFNKPSPRQASYLVLLFIIISFGLSIWLIPLTSLNFIYAIPITAIGLYSIYRAVLLVKDSSNREMVDKAWSTLSMFKMIAALAILLNILYIS